MKKFLSILLALIMMLTCFASCKKNDDENKTTEPTSEELITERIETFLTAYNGGDMNSVLECLDSKSRNAMSAMLNLLGGLAGSQIGFDIDLRDLFSLGVAIESDDFMKLQITDITVTGTKNAVATTTMDLTGAGVQTIYFHMVYENGGWYISDMTDKKGGVSNENNSDTAINITDFNSADIVEFLMDGKEYIGLINSKGEIFYYIEDDYISWTSVGNGAGYVTYTQNDETIYDIVNQSGNVVASLKKGSDLDEIMGYGDGFMLVYKNTSNISKEAHSYGVLNAATGEWDKPLQEGTKLPNGNFFSDTAYLYIGSGSFLKYYYSGNAEHYVLYNSTFNKAYYIDNCVIDDMYLTNGNLYGRNVGGWLTWGDISCSDDPDTHIDLPEYFTVSPNGVFAEVEPFVKSKNGIVIRRDSTEEYYIIQNLNTNTTVIYDDFKIDSIVGVEIVDDNVLFSIRGADGKNYFILVDKFGDARFDPIAIVYSYVTVSGNEIIYRAYGSEYYCMIDLQGNVIVSEDECYSSMYFSKDNNLISAQKSNDEACLLDRTGKAIVVTLKTK